MRRLAGLVTLASWFFCGAAAAADSATIPLKPFYKTRWVEDGVIDYNPFYYVNVAVGSPSATPNSVLVDTGSTGLYILQESLNPSNYSLTSTAFTYSYSSGNQISGMIGYATLYFPGAKDTNGNPITLATPAPVAFGVIQTMGCTTTNPDCPGYRTIDPTPGSNNSGWNVNQTGVMGVAYSGGLSVFNPLAQLAGNYANGFIFQANQAMGNTSPVLVVGLTAENTAGYTFANFASQGQTGGGIGLAAWNTKSIQTCFTTAGSTGCLQSIFDSGAGTASFQTAASGGPDSPVTGPVYTPVTIGVNGIMSFTSDLGSYAYAPEHGGTLGFNTGNEIFLYYTVAYDYVNGAIGFLPVGVIVAGQTAFTSDAQLGMPGLGVIVLGSMELGPGFVSSRPFNLAQSSYLDLGAPQIIVNGSATLNGSLSSAEAGYVSLSGVAGQANTLTLNGVSLFLSTLSIDVRNLTLAVNGILPGALWLESGAALGGTGLVIGSVDVRDGASIAPGNSIGTLTVAGTVRFTPGATYAVELGAPGSSDQLAVIGTVALQDATLALVGAPGTFPGLGSYTILTATGGISGTFSGVSGSFGTPGAQFPFLTPNLSYTAQSVLLTLDRSAVSYTTAAISANQRSVGTVADGLSVTNPVNIALSGLNAVTAPAAFDQISGEAYASVATGLQQQSFHLRDAAMARVRQALAPGGQTVASSRTADLLPGLPVTVWGQAYGGWGNVFGDGNAATLSQSVSGFLMGIDSPLDENWRIGVVGGYGQSGFDVDAVHSRADGDTYDLALYAGARFGGLGLRLGAGYGWHDLTMTRAVAFGEQAQSLSAAYGAQIAQVFGELGYALDFGATRAEPFGSLAYVHVGTDGFAETGGPAALTGLGTGLDTTYGVLGMRLGHLLPAPGGGTLALNASFGWQHAFGDLVPVQTVAFAGSDPFAIAGVPVARDSALVGAGLGFRPNANVELSVRYAGAFADTAQDNSVRGTFAYRF